VGEPDISGKVLRLMFKLTDGKWATTMTWWVVAMWEQGADASVLMCRKQVEYPKLQARWEQILMHVINV
jgi:hypothetical protein